MSLEKIICFKHVLHLKPLLEQAQMANAYVCPLIVDLFWNVDRVLVFHSGFSAVHKYIPFLLSLAWPPSHLYSPIPSLVSRKSFARESGIIMRQLQKAKQIDHFTEIQVSLPQNWWCPHRPYSTGIKTHTGSSCFGNEQFRSINTQWPQETVLWRSQTSRTASARTPPPATVGP